MPTPLRDRALVIWRASVEAVRAPQLVQRALWFEGDTLVAGSHRFCLSPGAKIAVVGAGKAGAGMAAGLEQSFGPKHLDRYQVAGWINVPEGIKASTDRIHLHPARPPGVNEPTAAACAGASEILEIVQNLAPDDLCVALISGGGSALLAAPVPQVPLEEKLAITRHLSSAGAPIDDLNTVRKQISRIKGGGLARACRAGRLLALIISDVLGDPLDIIASAPTVPDSSTPEAALAVLQQYGVVQSGIAPRSVEYLRSKSAKSAPPPTCSVTNLVIGNNATAVDAAAEEAKRLGFEPVATCATRSEGLAEPIGQRLAELAQEMRAGRGPDCLITGGEPVVRLAPADRRGRGGRNQQLALAAAERLWDEGVEDLVILSGGTDGEDGPTDAAGAFVDAQVLSEARRQQLVPTDFLARNDAYNFFAPTGGLILTGPTDTNVCDVRVVVVRRREAGAV